MSINCHWECLSEDWRGAHLWRMMVHFTDVKIFLKAIL